jgi:hypothetical protein
MISLASGSSAKKAKIRRGVEVSRNDDEERAKPGPRQSPENIVAMHSPDKLPDPWLFDSQVLLRELDRCREMVLLIPTPDHATYFAANIAINALWNLRQQLQYLIGLHTAMQRDWQAKVKGVINAPSDSIEELQRAEAKRQFISKRARRAT